MRSTKRTNTLKALTVTIALALAGAYAVSAPAIAIAQETGTEVTTASGLKITDTQVGTGETPKTG